MTSSLVTLAYRPPSTTCLSLWQAYAVKMLTKLSTFTCTETEECPISPRF